MKLKNIILKCRYKIKNKNIRFGKKTIVDSKCNISGNVFMGNSVVFKMSDISDHSYIANNSEINRTSIGKYCSIGSHVITAIGSHPTKKFVSTHPAFYSKSDEKVLGYTYVQENKYEEYPGEHTEFGKRSIVIGNDVWIGANVTIIEGTKIGDGVIVGAGSVVKGNIPDYAVVLGNPARIIRYRFDEDLIMYLKKYKWWDKDEKFLREKADYFTDIEMFLGALDNER